MSTSLIPIEDGGMSPEAFNKLATSSKFLPRIQLFGSSSTICKTGKFKPGNYGLISAGKETPYDLGDSIDLLVIGVRGKAMDISGDKPVSVFDMESDTFQDIVKRAGTPQSQCMYGPEFLVYLHATEKYATFFFANPTMRREAPELNKLRGQWATCGVRFIPSKQYGGWHGPEVSPCSTLGESDLPDREEITLQAKNFLDTSSAPQVEAVEEAAVANGREH